MALYELFSVSLIPVYHHRICYFPWIGGAKRGRVRSEGVAWTERRSLYTFPHYA